MLVLILHGPLGQKWKSHRKLIAPTFHLNVLKSFVDLFNANSRAVCEKMVKENGKNFDCHDYMSECTVEILLGKSKPLFQWFSTCEQKLRYRL
jgi:cytochrome P450 family 4